MAKLFLLLGGNIGNKEQIFASAFEMIENELGAVVGYSSIYETEPWGFESDDFFWNQVLVINTELEPIKVLEKTKSIEATLGRERKAKRYISRLIDIDLLFYDDLVLKSETLEIPHPRMIDRRFVLQPLAELAALKIHPVFNQTIAELLTNCTDQLEVKRLEDK